MQKAAAQAFGLCVAVKEAAEKKYDRPRGLESRAWFMWQ